MSASNASTPRTPLAGGQPISAEVADQAAEWLTVLMSGTASVTGNTGAPRIRTTRGPGRIWKR